MGRGFRCLVLTGLVAGAFSLHALTAQAQEATIGATVPRVIQFSGVLKNSAGQPLVGVQGVQFALYREQEGGAPLWIESQNVAADEYGRFAVLLGAATVGGTSGGLPVELFSSGESRWLGVQPQVSGESEMPRVLLVSVPYALKAADAETVGGLPPSAFVLAADAVTERVKDSGGLTVAAVSDGVSDGLITAQANAGTAGFIGKFFNTTDLDNSAFFQLGSNIGLGTTTPESALHIQGTTTDGITMSNGLNSGIGFLRFKRADGAIAGEIRSLLGTQAMVFNATGAERMRIAPSGFVGIGTNSPIAQLHVSGPGSTRMLFQGNAGTNGVIGLDMDSTARRWTLGAQGTNENGAFILFDFTASQRRMTVDSTGQFGIGTNSPTEKLDIVGNLKVSGDIINGSGSLSGTSGNFSGTTEGGSIFVGTNSSDADFSVGVRGEATATTGQTRGVEGVTASDTNGAVGVRGHATATTGLARGVFGITDSGSDFAIGVRGYATAPTGQTRGVAGRTDSASDFAVGVLGRATAITGRTRGVEGQADSASDFAVGVRGYADAATGQTRGVAGRTDSASDGATGVLGNASATTGQTYGVQGVTSSSTNEASGVLGEASAASGSTHGVRGTTSSTSDDASGVNGVADGATGLTFGVSGENDSTTDFASGVFGVSGALSGYGVGVLGVAVNATGTGGAFLNFSGTGQIISGRSGGGESGPWPEVFSVQGDGDVVTTTGDFQALAAGKGIILKSPDGNTCARLSIANSTGAVVSAVVTCP